jgi:hypothetical protein
MSKASAQRSSRLTLCSFLTPGHQWRPASGENRMNKDLQHIVDQTSRQAAPDRAACARKFEPVVRRLISQGRRPDAIVGAMMEVSLKTLDKMRLP